MTVLLLEQMIGRVQAVQRGLLNLFWLRPFPGA